MPRTYPTAERSSVVEEMHGTAVPDPYRWLEDAQDARTRVWVEEQQQLTDAHRTDWSMRDHFVESVAALLGAGAVSIPVHRGERVFFTRREPGQQFGVLFVRDDDGTERVLIDPIQLDPTGATTLDAWQPSKEGDRLAYQISEGGTEESVLYVMDVANAEVIDGPIDRCRYSPIAWIPGGEQFYYVRRLPPEVLPESEQGFHRRVMLHSVGGNADHDPIVFGAGMTITNYYGVEVSRDGQWLQISAAEGTEPRNDLWVADLTSTPADRPALQMVQADVDAQTSLTFGRDGRIYVSTDLDAPRGRLAVTTPGQWAAEQWRDLVPEDPEQVLESVALLDGDELDDDLLLVVSTAHGVARMDLRRAADGAVLQEVELPGAGTVAGPIERPEGGPIVWFAYTDHTSVPTIYSFDARDQSIAVYTAPPGQVDVPDAHSRLVEYTSADGTTVRMFVISPTADPDRPRPTVLYGYGGFGIPMQPGFSAAILSWVQAGGVWAVACLRGGGDEGESWHRDGMLDKKQNVFDDFHAAAEYLSREGWTTPEELGIYGGSNGGLLVGAAMTQRPELFNAVVCVAPLLDMIRYTTSELGPTWTVEYGDPEDPEQFGWLHAYSPYHRVREGTDYPATMFAVFDNDTRTDPMHGRKMCAAVQAATVGDRPILLRTEGNVGHGARKLDAAVEETADTLAFLAHWTGMEG
jgi:prolyl oligopeptidase